MNKKLDIAAAWSDALSLLRSNAEITLIIVGLFMLLPLVLFNLMAPQPVPAPGVTFDELMAMFSGWFSDNWYWFLTLTLFSAVGNMALLLVVLNPAKPTVEAALKLAVALLPVVLLTGLLQGLIIGLGFLLLLVPGIYFAVKLCLSSSVIAAEESRNPVEIFGRSWSLTKGNSLRIFGLLLLVSVGGWVATSLIGLVFGVIALLLLPASAAAIVVTVVSSALQMALTALIMYIVMAIYRQLSAA